MTDTPISPRVERPYRGLRPFEEFDAHLFAGREEELAAFTHTIGECSTRTIFLHGTSGCGKTSFLRAGVVPSLREMRGFALIPEAEPSLRRKVLIVRSGPAPLVRLARTLSEHFNDGYTVEIGNRRKQLRRDQLTRLARCRLVSAEDLFAALQDLTAQLSETLVLILDQAEEVFTGRGGSDEGARSIEFIRFLQLANDRPVDARLIVSLRTEYFGQLVSHIDPAAFDVGRTRQFYLPELNHAQLCRAIVHPAIKPTDDPNAVAGKFRLRFELGVVEKLASMVLDKSPIGGTLPVLQVLCDRLYDLARVESEPEVVIREAHLATLRNVTTALEQHLSDQIEAAVRWCLWSSKTSTAAEAAKWLRVLGALAQPQPDGTVTARVQPFTRLSQEAERLGCFVRADHILSRLAHDSVFVLKELRLTNTAGEFQLAYTLTHDAIAVALKKPFFEIDARQRWLHTTAQIAESVAKDQRLFVAGLVPVLLALATLFLVPPSGFVMGIIVGFIGAWGLALVFAKILRQQELVRFMQRLQSSPALQGRAIEEKRSMAGRSPRAELPPADLFEMIQTDEDSLRREIEGLIRTPPGGI